MGVAEGALDVGGNTLLIWVHRHKVGPFMNGLHFFFGAGAFLSPIIIAQTAVRSLKIFMKSPISLPPYMGVLCRICPYMVVIS